MEVLALFLVIFLGFSLLFRLPVAFGIGLGGAVVFAVFGYSMNSFSQTAFLRFGQLLPAGDPILPVCRRNYGVLRHLQEHLQLH